MGNLLGYRAARRGLHGKLYLHLRTGYVIQMGRYVALAIFLIVLAICSASMFMLGVAIAGVSSAARQLGGMRPPRPHDRHGTHLQRMHMSRVGN